MAPHEDGVLRAGSAHVEPSREAAGAAHDDCTQCKLIGGGTMLAVGAYFFVQTANLRRNSAELTNARFHTAVGTLFTAMGVYRLAMPLKKQRT